MNRLTRYGVAPFLSFLLVFVPLVVRAQSVSLSASNGNGTSDWLVHPNPLIVAPGQPASAIITIDPTGFPPVPNYTGRIMLSAICCEIPGNPTAPRVNPGLDVSVVRQTIPLVSPDSRLVPDLLRQPFPSLDRLAPAFIDVDVAGQPTQVRLNLTPQPVVGFGNVFVRVTAEDPIRGINQSIRLLVNVLPTWPPDGPAPACVPGLQVIPLSSLSGPQPGVYSWKASNPTRTSFAVGIADSAQQIGLEFNIRDERATPPLPPTRAVVRFTNTRGQPVGIRRSDSRNCAVPGPQLWAHVGNPPITFTINTSDTTTLVFSRTVCRAFFIFCWGRHGSDDVLQFSEGAFWTLFGGRAVDISTVGKWDKAINPFDGRAELEIKSP